MIIQRLAVLFAASTALVAGAALAQTTDQSNTTTKVPATQTQTTETQTTQTQQPAQITVQQPAAQVEVRQGQPEIIVHQPAPHVVVEIPQPQITVRMPQIEAQVKQEAPQVQVYQPQPKVEVTQPQQQSQVQVQSEGQPQVRYDMEQPKVEIKQAEGQPTVRFEQMQVGQTNQNTNTTTASNQTDVQKNTVTTTDQNQVASNGTTATQWGANGMQASRLINSTVYSASNENIGDVNDIVIGRDGRVYGVVIGVGGFLGLGEKDVIVPMDRIQFVRDSNNNPRYVIAASRAELEQAPAFDRRRFRNGNSG